MQLTKQQLQKILPRNKNIDDWYDALSKILPEYGIDTEQRIAAFIAQCAHESGGFTVLKENLNYRPATLRKVFPKYFPNDEIAVEYCNRINKQQAIANRVYANRMGNGNEESGDGWRFAGKGLIQLTGRNNYTLFAKSIGMSVEEASEYIVTFEGAVKSACWFWKTNNLNQWVDKGDIVTLTKRINGGTNGLSDRIKHYDHALHVLKA